MLRRQTTTHCHGRICKRQLNADHISVARDLNAAACACGRQDALLFVAPSLTPTLTPTPTFATRLPAYDSISQETHRAPLHL